MKPKPLVALNHFTVPMLTGVVPSQVDIVEAHFSGGLVRSNFWKGRQRLNRLYRWIANVVRPKIDEAILCENSPQNNPEVHDFLICADSSRGRSLTALGYGRARFVRLSGIPALSSPELATRRCTARRATTWTFVLVTEDQSG